MGIPLNAVMASWKWRIKRINYTQTSFAKAAGVGAVTLSALLNKPDPNPSIKTFVAIENKLEELERKSKIIRG